MYPNKSALVGVLIGAACSTTLISVFFTRRTDRNVDIINRDDLREYSIPENRSIFDISRYDETDSFSVLSVIKCSDKRPTSEFKQRGNFWVFYNFVMPEKRFKCDESITLTAPADFRFLDNLPPLVDVWRGPISVALYTPGDDFETTLSSIAYLRNCLNTTLIREFVTFHVFFPDNHIPNTQRDVPLSRAYEDDIFDCTADPPFAGISDEEIYKNRHNLTYPINVARNIARETALTHFVFPSDIELFPTPNFITKFFEMVVRKRSVFLNKNRKVFVLPVFEIEADQTVPQNKTRLQKMMKEKHAIIFHAKICKMCHAIIGMNKWIRTKEKATLDVLSVGKRHGNYRFWEPFYVGTNQDPLFDERLSWEGQSNKMSQAFMLCVMNYDFMILDNAFLTHKPGIKKKKAQIVKHKKLVDATNKMMPEYKKELVAIYGENKNCKISNIDH